jgi:biopolymer transport protein ExbD
MSGSRIARRQSRNHARYRGRNDINIVPMLDVMVILIFFLIFTAVFSKMNILELNLPEEGGPPPLLPAVLELEVIVRAGAIEVADRNTGLLQSLPNTAVGADYMGLSNYLRRVKLRFPEKKDATVLLEPDVPYDVMVQTMDTMKSFETMLEGQPVRGELFPKIAIGDAPEAPSAAARIAQR